MKRTYPVSRYIYIVQISITSVCLFFGLHRLWYSGLDVLSLPEFLRAGLTGMANLAWYEAGYVVGGGFKNAHLFTGIPILGCISGFASAAMLILHSSYARMVLWLHIGLSTTLSVLAMGILLWRFMRGFEDYWRLIAVGCFFLLYCFWSFIFYSTQNADSFSRK